jgi:hypothetical protein
MACWPGQENERHLLKGPLTTAPALSANGCICIARDGQLSALRDCNKPNQWEQSFSTRWQLDENGNAVSWDELSRTKHKNDIGVE